MNNRRTAFTLTDLILVLLLTCLLFPVVLHAGGRSRETANRVKCGSNLRSIGQAIMLYANENKGAYPRTHYVADAPPQATSSIAEEPDPFAGVPATRVNDITQAIFLLIRTQDITSEVFVCPTSNAEKDNYLVGTNPRSAQNKSTFSDYNKNLSYSYANPYPTTAAVNAGYRLNSALGAEFAVAADINPGGAALTTLTVNSPPNQMKDANSKNHQAAGQNVLYGDGHVDFQQNPFCGVKMDNIYTVGAPSPGPVALNSTTIEGSPTWDGDSVLLPIGTLDPSSIASVARTNLAKSLFVGGMVLLAAIGILLAIITRKRPALPQYATAVPAQAPLPPAPPESPAQ